MLSKRREERSEHEPMAHHSAWLYGGGDQRCRVDVIDEKQFVGKSMHYKIPCFVDSDVNREKFVGSLTFL